MRPVSFKHLLARPALLIAAGLVLLGATSGQASTLGEVPSIDAERSCRSPRPSLDMLCRCLSASFAPDEDSGGFSHVGLYAAFDPSSGWLAAPVAARFARAGEPHRAPASRLRLCRVGPSPPR